MVAPRISPVDAREKIRRSEALLVCSYDDDDRCAQIKVDDSISFTDFQSRLSTLPKDQQIVFY